MSEQKLHIHMDESFQDGVDYALQYLKQIAQEQQKSKLKLKDFISHVE